MGKKTNLAVYKKLVFYDIYKCLKITIVNLRFYLLISVNLMEGRLDIIMLSTYYDKSISCIYNIITYYNINYRLWSRSRKLNYIQFANIRCTHYYNMGHFYFDEIN